VNDYQDVAETDVFVAGREAARSMVADGIPVTAGDAEIWCPRGMGAELEAAWIRGWRGWLGERLPRW
jgi:hypothetical protein